MMKCKWYIQKCSVNDTNTQEITAALDRCGSVYSIIEVVPFSYDISSVSLSDTYINIPYGGTKFIESIVDDPRWLTFFDPRIFTYSHAICKLGKLMFNHDAEFMKINEFNKNTDELFFIRPDGDTKAFNGLVTSGKDFLDTFYNLNGDVSNDIDIMVSSPSRIDEEWRVWIVNGHVISGSRYKLNGCLNKLGGLTEEVIKFTNNVISIYQPMRVFVIDICRVNDSYAVVEIGDFHGAGFYDADIAKIINAVEKGFIIS